jgi:hypothetical protein
MFAIGQDWNATLPEFDPGGTAPDWISALDAYEMGYRGLHVAWAIATSSSHTTGAWMDTAQGYIAVVETGKSVGAVNVSLADEYYAARETTKGDSVTVVARPDNLPIVCPAVTLQNTSGSSILIHHAYCYTDDIGPVGWLDPAPSGYTVIYRDTDNTGQGETDAYVIGYKDSSTSDGAVAISSISPGTLFIGKYTATVEVLT